MRAGYKRRLTEALKWLVVLYDAWGKKDQADAWRRQLQAHHAASNGATKPKEK